MSYKSEPISAIISRLNNVYFLPAIQREFVWSEDQIIALFDSVIRGYPICSFLFWELNKENRDTWHIYEFIKAIKPEGSHNELVSTSGMQQVVLVLDGQQRLTSLYIGLKGILYSKYRGKVVSHYLYLNLLKEITSAGEHMSSGNIYGYEFRADERAESEGEYWFKVGAILDFDTSDKFQIYRDQLEDQLQDRLSRQQLRTLKNNLDSLYQSIWQRDAISYYTEHGQDYNRVLDIFVRANEGGTKLSKSDLLLSMATSKWKGIDAREEIHDFVEHINKRLGSLHSFDKDFVLKSSLALCDLDIAYNIKNFSTTNLEKIRDHWDSIKESIELGVRLISSFGFNKDSLPSANAIIPIIYYIHAHRPYNILGSSQAMKDDTEKIRKWLLIALLNNVFTGHSDLTLTVARKVINDYKHVREFPHGELSQRVGESGRTFEFGDNLIRRFVDISYGKKPLFLALSLLYDYRPGMACSYECDHIFARSEMTERRLAKVLSAERMPKNLDEVNKISNLRLLTPEDNREKGDMPIEEWLLSRSANYRKQHLIPDDRFLYKYEKFDDFILARKKLIEERLRNIFSASSMPISGVIA